MPPAPHAASGACAICRRRKVRCDKGRPCGNCVRMHTDCVYLPTQPRQRRSQSRRQREMLERLRKLEGMVAGMDLAGQDQAHSASSSPPGNGNFGGSPSPSLDAIGQLSESFGRLEVREGRSMWFSNGLMAAFHAEVRNPLRPVLGMPRNHRRPGRWATQYDCGELR